MIVTLERIEPIEEAFGRLRQAVLESVLNDEKIQIYKNARMRISDFYPSELNPTSLYVLRTQLDLMRKIRQELLNHHAIDILKLSSILHLRTSEGKLIGMAPPFVEFYRENIQIIPSPTDKQPPQLNISIPIIKDGFHRAWIAREENEFLRCITVHGALSEHQPYAYPNSWSEVKIYDTKPDLKKYYRRHNPYTYLRPLSALRQTSDAPPKPEWGR